jgi:hypothetical protein
MRRGAAFVFFANAAPFWQSAGHFAKKAKCAAPTIFIFFLFASLLFAQDKIRRNFSWSLEGGNDPILQVKNESDDKITIEVRVIFGDDSYRYPEDLEVPSAESRFLRIGEIIQSIAKRYPDLKSVSTGTLQIQFTGENDSVRTTIINLNPKLGLTSEKADSSSVPRIVSIQPENGSPTGGTIVKILGDHFSDSTAVRFGGVVAMRTMQSTGILIAVAPPHPTGSVDVEVANGKSSARLRRAFHYQQDSPTIQKLDPDFGPSIGGVRVSIRGHNFQPGAKILWEGRAIPARFISGEELMITAPAGQRGSVNVEIVNPDDTRFVLEDAFHYQGAPRVLSIQPRMGGPAGGYTVTISGENFEPGCSVLFGTQYAQTTFINPGTLAAVVPSGDAGITDVSVSTQHGETDTLESAFLYNDPPVIYSVTAVPNPIVRNTTTTITVEADDPEAGPLDFEYRIAQGAGSITGQGKTAVYNSPNIVQTTVIQITVYDEHRAKAQHNLEIRVE